MRTNDSVLCVVHIISTIKTKAAKRANKQNKDIDWIAPDVVLYIIQPFAGNFVTINSTLPERTEAHVAGAVLLLCT